MVDFTSSNSNTKIEQCVKGKCESYDYSVKMNIVHTIVTCLFVYTCIDSEFGTDKTNDESEDKNSIKTHD
jgi:hypothetical protein